MAETLVENRTCSACGVDVRMGALFCYNCGGSVAPQIPVPETPAPENHEPASDVWFKENIVEEKIEEKVEEKPAEVIEEAPPADEKEVVAETTDKPDETTGIHEQAKLKSAASLRRKAKTIQKRKVEEVIWTGHENAPNGWFILVALVLTAFAVAVFWLVTSVK
jgi:uncharacterized Zn finger protein (UPF0148 family)